MESRIREKLRLAGGVVGRVGAKIEARADALIARETEEFDPAIDESFRPHESMLNESKDSLDEFRDELKVLSNSPLSNSPTSGTSPKVAPTEVGAETPGTFQPTH